MDRQKFAFDEDTVRHFARNLGQCIKYLHDRNIVHRDIKAENILFKQLESIQEPILTDFEYARMLEPGEMCTELCGTRGCMSPELLNKEPYVMAGLDAFWWTPLGLTISFAVPEPKMRGAAQPRSTPSDAGGVTVSVEDL